MAGLVERTDGGGVAVPCRRPDMAERLRAFGKRA
jgi:hypothetical protein